VNVRETVYERVKDISEQQRKPLPPLTDNIRLLEDGLDSLAVAILIAALDDELNLDPFSSDTVEVPVTIGDLVHVYEHAATVASLAHNA
jgi:acyl carrier protein